MKLTIDTVNKTVKVDQVVLLTDLMRELGDLGINLNEYSLVGTETVLQSYPVYPMYPYYTSPVVPVGPTYLESSYMVNIPNYTTTN